VLNNPEALQAIVEKNADGIIVLDADRRIQYLNPAAAALLDRGREELKGFSFDYILLPGEKTEVDLLRRDGRPVVAELRNASIRIADKPFELVSLRDITHKKHAEEELSLMKKFEAISILAGGISHDFNNLLCTIIGFIELSMDEPLSADELRDYLSEAHTAAEEARDLTERFLQLSDHMAPTPYPVSVPLLVRTAMAPFYESHNARFQTDLPRNLHRVMADEMQVTKALRNILNNAFDAIGPEGCVRVIARNTTVSESRTVSPFTIEKGTYVEIAIEDDGRGIAKANLAHIFDPYFSTKQRSVERGMGLGLSTAYNIIKSHKGYILATSVEKRGTTISVYLPVAEGAGQDPAR
jgi:signal transduction histidine kinase